MIIDSRIKTDINDQLLILEMSTNANFLIWSILCNQVASRKKTALLGNYYGIFKDQQLIAVTGERMQMDDMIEVSAVVTHPDHTGKGYASQLIAHAVNQIFDRGKLPFLHVASTNTGAIKLYEKLGFNTRKKISFWNLIANQ